MTARMTEVEVQIVNHFQFLLTDKLLCQDSLEQYFGHQRGGTGSNNAPTMSEYIHLASLLSLRRPRQASPKVTANDYRKM